MTYILYCVFGFNFFQLLSTSFLSSFQGRTESFDQIALDIEPEADDIGAGTIIFFSQGTYRGSEGKLFSFHKELIGDQKVTY